MADLPEIPLAAIPCGVCGKPAGARILRGRYSEDGSQRGVEMACSAECALAELRQAPPGGTHPVCTPWQLGPGGAP